MGPLGRILGKRAVLDHVLEGDGQRVRPCARVRLEEVSHNGGTPTGESDNAAPATRQCGDNTSAIPAVPSIERGRKFRNA